MIQGDIGKRTLNRIRLMRQRVAGSSEFSGRAGWIETFTVSLVTIAVAWLVRPEDPFLIRADFPWLLVASLFLSLRHGFAFGFSSALFFIAAMVISWRYGWIELEQFPSTLVLGSLVVTMLGGEFSDLWQRRLGRIEIESGQRDRRMEEFTRSYHLLKVSHDQLVEQLAGSSVSMRQAIAGLREEMAGAEQGSDPLEAEAETILALFRRYGAVQSASLHRVVEGKPDIHPLGRLGAVPEDVEALRKSVMIAECLQHGEMVTVLASENGSPRYVDGNILAVVPIYDQSGYIRGLLVIYRIPFLKFTRENLGLIAVMGGYLGDLLTDLEQSLKSPNEIRDDFLSELNRTIKYVDRFGINAKLLAIEVEQPDTLNDLISQRRSLDRIWTCRNRTGKEIVLWLMPFTDDYGLAGFQARINLWARTRDESGDENNLIHPHIFPLTGKQDVDEVMTRVGDACDIAGL